MRTWLRPYLAVLKARARMLLQYRAAALAGFGTQLFWGGIRVMIFDAFYRSTSLPQPLTYEQTVTYLWLIQAMLLIVPFRIEADLANLIRTGGVAYELARPIDLYGFWYARMVAARTAPVVLRATPMFIVAGLFLGLQPPASWGAAGVWVLSMIGAVALSSAIGALMAVSLMWTISGDGMARFVGVLVYILSGQVIPLPFFPEWSQPILNFLPFRGLVDVPFRIYMGDIAPPQGLLLLGHQALWTVALVLLGRFALSRGTRRLVIQGG